MYRWKHIDICTLICYYEWRIGISVNMRKVSEHSGVTVGASWKETVTKADLFEVCCQLFSFFHFFINFSFPLLLSATLDFEVFGRHQSLTKCLVRSQVTTDSPLTVSHSIPSHVTGQWDAKLKKKPFHTGAWHYYAEQIAGSCAVIPVLWY